VSLKYGAMVTKADLLVNHCWGIVDRRLSYVREISQ
jgi:hypothetical protein